MSIMNMDTPDLLQLKDLGLIASLVSAEHRIAKTETANGRVYFLFQPSDGLDSDIQNYWAKELSVDARTLNENLKMLKSRIYGGAF